MLLERDDLNLALPIEREDPVEDFLPVDPVREVQAAQVAFSPNEFNATITSVVP